MVAKKTPTKRKPATKKTPVKKAQSKAVVSWEDQMLKDAEIAAKAEASTGGGQFFSCKSGVLSWDDAPIPGNKIPVIVLASVFENVLYEGAYNKDEPNAPTCFAFAEDEANLIPHTTVEEAGQSQSSSCEGCEHNEWGSADTGRGKACSNTRRLALLPAGSFDRDGNFDIEEEVSHYSTSTIGFLKLPVMSVKGFSGFVKQIANSLKRPPYGVIAELSVVPDDKSQFRVVFEAIEIVPDEFMEAVIKRREEALSTIDFPYQLEVDAPAAKPARRAKKAPAPKKRAPKKRNY